MAATVTHAQNNGLATTVTYAQNNGLEQTVTHAHQVGLVMTVTPALTDGFLRPVIRSVTDSAAVTKVIVRAVSRMVGGRHQMGAKFISHSEEKNALT